MSEHGTLSEAAAVTADQSSVAAAAVTADQSTILSTFMDVINAFFPKQEKKLSKQETTVHIIDTSGSTGNKITDDSTILDFEKKKLSESIVKGGHENNIVVSFACTAHVHNIVYSPEFPIQMPQFKSGGTSTHLAFIEVGKLIAKGHRFDRVVLFTDGQTCSPRTDILKSIAPLIERKIPIDIVAVSNSNFDPKTLSTSEQQGIPGMDLINWIGNSARQLEIYNQRYLDEPFIGAVNTHIDKNCITFFEHRIQGSIPLTINNILEHIKTYCFELILNDPNQEQVIKQFIAEFGKLLSLIYVNIDQPDSYISLLILNIVDALKNKFTPERVFTILKYGLKLSNNSQPLVMTGFENNVNEFTDQSSRQAQFKDADKLIALHGSTLGKPSITIPSKLNGCCVLMTDPRLLTKKEQIQDLTAFCVEFDGPNQKLYEQAIRQAIRSYLEILGFPNAKKSANVIFYISNQMFLMFLAGIDMNSEHMQKLRILARIQASYLTMIGSGKYDLKGCFERWNDGEIPKLHYSEPKTHVDLYTDQNINPCKLPQPIWWALQMSMFGIFNEQLSRYEVAIRAICDENHMEFSEDNFLAILKAKYKCCVDHRGESMLIKLAEQPKSIFTYDEFPPGSTLMRLKNHMSVSGHICSVNQIYSISRSNPRSNLVSDSETNPETISEIEWVRSNGCVYCKYHPNESDWEPITELSRSSTASKLESIKNAKPFTFDSSVLGSIANISSGSSIIQAPVAVFERPKIIPTDQVVCVLQGLIGSGKTTFRKNLEQYLLKQGYKVLVISPDDMQKSKRDPRDINPMITKFLQDFNKQKHALIFDMCNDQGYRLQSMFGRDFSTYTHFEITPNFYPDSSNFVDYLYWSLNNLMKRPAFTPDTDFYLNTIDTNPRICLEVFNKKANGIQKIFKISNTRVAFDTNMTTEEVIIKVINGAERYAQILATKPSIPDQIDALLKTKGI